MIWKFFFLVVASATSLECVNFYGLETEKQDFVCGWENRPRYYLQKLKSELGIKSVRVPFSYEYALFGNFTSLDELFEDAKILNLKIILDFHRVWNDHQSSIPEDGISRDEYLRIWELVLDRYSDNPLLTGIGLFNEVQHGDYAYLNNLYGQMIIYINYRYGPKRFYYYLGCGQWGSNCTGIVLPVRNSAYEIHVYPFSKKFQDLIPETSRVFVGEFGFKESDNEWGNNFLSYLKERDINNACFWTIAHSVDTDGLWKDDCKTIYESKWEILKRF